MAIEKKGSQKIIIERIPMQLRDIKMEVKGLIKYGCYLKEN
jgi:hypothetical protein